MTTKPDALPARLTAAERREIDDKARALVSKFGPLHEGPLGAVLAEVVEGARAYQSEKLRADALAGELEELRARLPVELPKCPKCGGSGSIVEGGGDGSKGTGWLSMRGCEDCSGSGRIGGSLIMRNAAAPEAPKAKCQAEDQGGWPACDKPATLQTKTEPRRYYCAEHKTNRHVWREDELEPIPTGTSGGG